MKFDRDTIKYAFQNFVTLGPGAGAPTVYLSNLFNPDTSLATFFSILFYAALAIGAMLAVLRLGYAGFKYMATDVFHVKRDAKEIISQTILGLLLLLSVWLILNQINPDILNLNILRSIPTPPTNLPAQNQNSPFGGN